MRRPVVHRLAPLRVMDFTNRPSAGDPLRLLVVGRGTRRAEVAEAPARELGIAETTVKIHVQHILRKLNLSSRVQAAVFATEAGAQG